VAETTEGLRSPRTSGGLKGVLAWAVLAVLAFGPANAAGDPDAQERYVLEPSTASAAAAYPCGDEILRESDGGVWTLEWSRIRGDQHAISCLSRLTSLLGQDAMEGWLRSQGFSARFMTGRSDYRLLSASWGIKANGLRYWPGLLHYLQTRHLAHGMTISLRWYDDGRHSIRISYTYK